jgi:hypothetical protein
VLVFFDWCRGTESNCRHGDFQPDQDQNRKPVISDSKLILLAFSVTVMLGGISSFLEKWNAAGTNWCTVLDAIGRGHGEVRCAWF